MIITESVAEPAVDTRLELRNNAPQWLIDELVRAVNDRDSYIVVTESELMSTANFDFDDALYIGHPIEWVGRRSFVLMHPGAEWLRRGNPGMHVDDAGSATGVAISTQMNTYTRGGNVAAGSLTGTVTTTWEAGTAWRDVVWISLHSLFVSSTRQTSGTFRIDRRGRVVYGPEADVFGTSSVAVVTDGLGEPTGSFAGGNPWISGEVVDFVHSTRNAIRKSRVTPDDRSSSGPGSEHKNNSGFGAMLSGDTWFSMFTTDGSGAPTAADRAELAQELLDRYQFTNGARRVFNMRSSTERLPALIKPGDRIDAISPELQIEDSSATAVVINGSTFKPLQVLVRRMTWPVQPSFGIRIYDASAAAGSQWSRDISEYVVPGTGAATLTLDSDLVGNPGDSGIRYPWEVLDDVEPIPYFPEPDRPDSVRVRPGPDGPQFDRDTPSDGSGSTDLPGGGGLGWAF